MTRIEIEPAVYDDFDRFVAHLRNFEVPDPMGRIGEIVAEIDILARAPLIGRRVEGGLRELIIGCGGRGYVALYRYVREIDTVFVLAVRAQKEAGYW